MNLFLLAYRNIGRHKKRTILTSLTVIMGVFLFSFMDSMNRGLAEESFRNVKEFETGYFQIEKDTYFTDRDGSPLDESFNPSSVIAAIPSGQPYTTRSYVKVEANIYEDPYPYDGTFNLIGIVVDPIKDKEVFKTNNFMVRGSYIDENTPPNGVVIGSILADQIGAEVGYPITFSMRTRKGVEQVIDATIVGIFATPTGKLNQKYIYFSKKDMDNGLQLDGEVNSLCFALGELTPQAEYNKLMATLKPHLPEGVSSYLWSETANELIAFVKFKDITTYFITLLIFIMTFVGISNTLLMSINERSFEVGALMSMGMRRWELLRLFTYEGTFIGIIGAFIGFLLALIANTWLVNIGFSVDGLDKGTLEVPYRISSNLRGAWNFSGMFIAIVVAIVVSSFSAFVATFQFTKQSIIACLKGESV